MLHPHVQPRKPKDVAYMQRTAHASLEGKDEYAIYGIWLAANAINDTDRVNEIEQHIKNTPHLETKVKRFVGYRGR